MKNITLLLLLLSCKVNAQETALSVFAGVDKVISGLRDLEQQIGGTVAISINQVSQNLNAHQQELKQTLGSKVTEPIQNLSLNIQNQVRLLKNTADNLNQFLSWQQECIFKNVETFKAGLLTAGLQLESNIRIIGKKNDPLVSSISFDGKPNYIVPMQGGRLTIKGFNLYENYAPLVRIHNERRNAILMENMKVDKGSSNNEVSIYLDEDFIKKYLGTTIYFEVIPRKPRWLISGSYNLSSVYIPLRIPDVTKYKYKIKAFVTYKWIKTEIIELNDQPWGKEEQNSNCGQVRAASDSHTWNICDECKIINVKGGATEQRYMDDGGNMTFSIPSRDVIAYGGTIGRPKCLKVWPIEKLFSHAYWRFSIWPEIKKTSYIEEQNVNESTIFSLDDINKNILITLPINENSRKETIFWYQLMLVKDNNTEDNIYTSPRYNSDDNGVSADTYIKKDGYRFDAILNNKTTNNTVQVSTTIKPPPCGQL